MLIATRRWRWRGGGRCCSSSCWRRGRPSPYGCWRARSSWATTARTRSAAPSWGTAAGGSRSRTSPSASGENTFDVESIFDVTEINFDVTGQRRRRSCCCRCYLGVKPTGHCTRTRWVPEHFMFLSSTWQVQLPAAGVPRGEEQADHHRGLQDKRHGEVAQSCSNICCSLRKSPNQPQDPEFAMMFFGADYPKSFFGFGHPRARGSYKSFFLQVRTHLIKWRKVYYDRKRW